MSPLSPVQVEHLYIAYQLLSEAQVKPPEAVLIGTLNGSYLAANILDEITEFFMSGHGLDEEVARQSAEASTVHSALVRIPLTMDVLRLLLGAGLPLDGDEALVTIDSGSALPVTISRDMRVRVTLGNLSNLVVAPADAILSEFLQAE